MSVFTLPDDLSFDEGAAIPMNYLTAHFALADAAVCVRARRSSSTARRAASGRPRSRSPTGTAPAPSRWSAPTKRPSAAAGADEVVLLDGFKDAVLA